LSHIGHGQLRPGVVRDVAHAYQLRAVRHGSPHVVGRQEPAPGRDGADDDAAPALEVVPRPPPRDVLQLACEHLFVARLTVQTGFVRSVMARLTSSAVRNPPRAATVRTTTPRLRWRSYHGSSPEMCSSSPETTTSSPACQGSPAATTAIPSLQLWVSATWSSS